MLMIDEVSGSVRGVGFLAYRTRLSARESCYWQVFQRKDSEKLCEGVSRTLVGAVIAGFCQAVKATRVK